MDFQTLAEWYSEGTAWAVTGILLAIVEMAIGTIVAVTMGGAAILVSLGFWAGILSGWEQGLLALVVAIPLTVLPLRMLSRKFKRETPDVNEARKSYSRQDSQEEVSEISEVSESPKSPESSEAKSP